MSALRIAVGAALLATVINLTACIAWPNSNLKPGISTIQDVEDHMGRPTAVWRDGSGQVEQVAYPTNPAGFVTFMLYFDPQGKLTKIEQTLNERHFAMVKNGDDEAQVLKILGPYRDTNVFSSTNQLDWNYGYCSIDGWRMLYSVTFDEKSLVVNGSLNNPDPLWAGADRYAAPCQPYPEN